MTVLEFGDVCICDLSLSLNSSKQTIAPLVFIGKEYRNGSLINRFCRVGKKPKQYAFVPFIVVRNEPALRNNAAIYPTQYVFFSDDIAPIKMLGRIQTDETLAQIRTAVSEHRKDVALVMSLCPRCREDFRTDRETVINRLNPFHPEKSECDFCQIRQGYLYVIYKKKIYRSDKRR